MMETGRPARLPDCDIGPLRASASGLDKGRGLCVRNGGEAGLAAHGLALRPVESRAALQAFIRMPLALYRDDPCYVPPLLFERRRHFDPRVNPFFREARSHFWLAMRGDRPVGRIGAVIDPAAQPPRSEPIGQFGYLEAEDDPAVFAALLGAAEEWLRSAGIGCIRGPFNPSINDECGLLIDGFGRPPMVMMGHARPYYGLRLEEAGYEKAKDLLAYEIRLEDRMPALGERLRARLGGEGRIAVRPIDRRRYAEEIRKVVDIFNDAWAENWGFVPLTGARLGHLERSLKPLLSPDLAVIAELDGVPAGMMVALPNLNEAIADLGGRLLPVGWVRLLWRLRAGRIRSARVPLMGVRRRFQRGLVGAAIMTLMFAALHSAGRRRGIERIEMSWVLEDNRPMRHLAEGMGATPYKTYRIYERRLAA